MKGFIDTALVLKFLKKILWIILIYILVAGILSYFIPAKNHPRTEAALEMARDWEAEGDNATSPDRVKAIGDPTEAFAVRLSMIRAAENYVDVVYYAIDTDESSQAFLSELVDAADRGVKVRLMVDGKMGGLPKKYRRALASHPNIEFGRYNPVKIHRPWTLFEGLHDKIILLDNKYALTGGRNVGDPYFALANPLDANKHDWDIFMVKDSGGGPLSVVDALEAYYEDLWTNKLNRRVKAKKSDPEKIQELLTDGRKFLADKGDLYDRSVSDFVDSTFSAKRIKVFHNPLEARFGKNEAWVLDDLTDLASQATTSAYVQTPYATGTKPIMDFLSVLGQDLDTTFITNSLYSANNIMASPNYLFQRKKFLDTGINIYEYLGEESIHGKAMVFDNQITLVGSFNMDSRSVNLNTETMVVVDSPDFTQDFMAQIKPLLDQSLQVGWDNKFIEREDFTEPEVEKGKKTKFFMSFILFRLIQFFI
ncbi:phosphatidylserine/phosphatidylglycerophosphate/cardiolipin synthase family protein [uncultured Ezakiella sp.]|uniref:phospholipase D-like domain-containing protein n=1 Tax=uncultured Ezakiella sp. TaxID=1637529 RepID=UPI0025EDCFCC|nr:phosphatidylserine/phosphatidylglycerophosphate/cardiolipin synthase family protein [uncultured Ezakiella sp.]